MREERIMYSISGRRRSGKTTESFKSLLMNGKTRNYYSCPTQHRAKIIYDLFVDFCNVNRIPIEYCNKTMLKVVVLFREYKEINFVGPDYITTINDFKVKEIDIDADMVVINRPILYKNLDTDSGGLKDE